MKNTKRLLAVVLAIVLVLSCMSTMSLAAEQKTGKTETTATAREEAAKGFKSESFRLNNTYQYSDDEQVRAIIVMNGDAAGKVSESKRAAVQTKLAAQHNTLRKAMKSEKINYTLTFDYDTLLNGMAIQVAYGDLDKISGMNGVDAVYIANQYAIPDEDVQMESSNEMTGASNLHSMGITGSNTVIAILDTGITPGHEAFAVYGDMLKNPAITQENAQQDITDLGYGTYLSQKIPFSYDYYDKDNDATDDKSGHGTHVAGIAAGYAENSDGAITFTGAAPDAQILALKIFSSGSQGFTSSDVYFAALEDAYKLGADVINMSIGAQNGFTYDSELENEVYGNIYQTLEDNGIICVVAAGNEYSMAQYSSNKANSNYSKKWVTGDYADYGVVGSPSTYDGNLSVASVENAEYPAYVLVVGDRNIAYNDSTDGDFVKAMGGKSLEYVMVPNNGEAADYTGLDITGKVAVVSRGGITFQDKVNNAAAAGAVALVVYNNTTGTIGMSISTYPIPAVSILKEDGTYLKTCLETAAATTTAVATQISKASEIVAEGKYILAAKLNDNYYALSNTAAIDGPLDGKAVTVADGKISTVDAKNVFTAKAGSATGTFTLSDADGKFVFLNATNSTAIKMNTTGSDLIFADTESGITANFSGSTRYLCLRDASSYSTDAPYQFRAYAQSNISASGYNGNLTVFKVETVAVPAEPVLMTFPEKMATVANDQGYLMSDFSSWGCTNDLRLKPQITGVGGHVYSAAFNTTDGYTVMSGTSMATPDITGCYAAIIGGMKKSSFYKEMTPAERAAFVEAYTESNAQILMDSDGYIYSPRKQGAGLINFVEDAQAVIKDPICNVGDSADGVFEINFTVYSPLNEIPSLTYTIDPVVMVDFAQTVNVGTNANPDNETYNTLTSDYITDNCTITTNLPDNTLTLTGNTPVDVTVTITLNDTAKAKLDADFTNGAYVEGYINLKRTDSDVAGNLHATFLGFYGNWEKAPILEQHDWREIVDINTLLQTTVANAAGNTYAELGVTYLDAVKFQVNTDVNATYLFGQGSTKNYATYAGDSLFDYVTSGYLEDRIAVSTGEADGAHYCDRLYIMPMTLRNARHMIMVVTNTETGEIYAVDDTEYMPKAAYDTDNSYWPSTANFFFNGQKTYGVAEDADPEYVPNNTKLTVSFYANLAYGEDELGAIDYENLATAGESYLCWSFPCTIDSQAPVIDTENFTYDEAAGTLTVTVSDNQYLAQVSAYDKDYNLLDSASFADATAGQSHQVTLKVGENAIVYVAGDDFATNESDELVITHTVPCKLTFHTPEGITIAGDNPITVNVGDNFVMPDVEGQIPGYEFVAWVPAEVASSDGSDLKEFYLAADEYFVTGDTEFYALFSKEDGFYDPTVELSLISNDQEDWTGTYAIDGYDWATGKDYILKNDCSTISCSENNITVEYPESGVGYMAGAPISTIFDIEKQTDGTYTICAQETGKFIALDATAGNGIAFVDSATDAAKWNITFDDDLWVNYIVSAADPTKYLVFDNADSTIKATAASESDFDSPYDLYLFGLSQKYNYTTQPHVHALTAVEAKAPTCTENGNIAYWFCEGCGKYFSDAAATTEITLESTVLAALGHDYTSVVTKEATEDEEGIITYTCSRGDSTYTETIPMLFCPSKAFNDVDRSKWYHEAIDFVLNNGLFAGISKTTFGPDDAMTRGMIVTVLWALEGKPTSSVANSYIDVTESDYYYNAVLWATENKIVAGVGGQKFNPKGNVTREQIATIMYRYAEYKKFDTTARADLSKFPDVKSISSYAKDTMAWANAVGIINGTTSAGSTKVILDPKGSATRAQVAQILKSFTGKYEG